MEQKKNPFLLKAEDKIAALRNQLSETQRLGNNPIKILHANLCDLRARDVNGRNHSGILAC